MTFTLHEDLLRAALATDDGCEELDLPAYGENDSGLASHFDPRMDPDDTGLIAAAVFNAMGTIITSDVEDAKVALHAIDDTSGGYTFVTVSVPYGEPVHEYRPSLKVAGDTEESRKIGNPDEGVTPVEQVVAIFTEVVEEGNRLLAQLAVAAPSLVPAPTVEILHERDSDSDCVISVWVNGEQFTDYEYDDVDPGAGHTEYDLLDNIRLTEESDASPAFKAAATAAYRNALGSPYTTHD
jgi:hypothetical protein